MNNFFTLTKVLLKSGTNSGNKKKNKRAINIILMLVVAAALTPMAISIGAFSGVIYDSMVKIHQEGMVLMLAYTIASAIIMVFGIFYVMSVFYFSKDIETLLPLPLSPTVILSSKFLVTLVYEYFLEAIFLLPVIIDYGIKSSGNIAYYVLSLFMFLTIPIVPLVVASILSMILMRFTNIGKNKDRFKVMGSLLLMVAIFGFNTYANKITASSRSMNKIQAMLTEGNNSLINVFTNTFISAKLATLSVVNLSSNKGLINLALYILLNILLFVIFLVLAESLYLKGVVGLNQSVNKRRKLTNDILEKGTNSSSTLTALVLKELKILIRTPIYFLNCILMNFIWPIFVLIPIISSGGMKDIQKLGDQLIKPEFTGIAMAAAFGVSLFISASNSIASTSISREGQNLYFLKYIPVSYKKIINSKILSGIVISVIGVALMIITSYIILRPEIGLIIIALFMSTLGIIFSAETGILMDLFFPKLNWDTEQKAVKQNLNAMFNMFLCMALGGLVVFIVVKLSLELISAALFIFIVFGTLDYILYRIVMTVGVNRLKQIEN